MIKERKLITYKYALINRLTTFVLISLIILTVISYNIYAIYSNWLPLSIFYEEVFDFASAGGFLNGLLNVLIAPFMIFGAGISQNTINTGYIPLNIHYQASLILEATYCLLIFFILVISHLIEKKISYHSFKDRTSRNTLYFNNYVISEEITPIEEALDYKNIWIAIGVLFFTVIIAPIGSIIFFIVYLIFAIPEKIDEIKRYKLAKNKALTMSSRTSASIKKRTAVTSIKNNIENHR